MYTISIKNKTKDHMVPDELLTRQFNQLINYFLINTVPFDKLIGFGSYNYSVKYINIEMCVPCQAFINNSIIMKTKYSTKIKF